MLNREAKIQHWAPQLTLTFPTAKERWPDSWGRFPYACSIWLPRTHDSPMAKAQKPTKGSKASSTNPRMGLSSFEAANQSSFDPKWVLQQFHMSKPLPSTLWPFSSGASIPITKIQSIFFEQPLNQVHVDMPHQQIWKRTPNPSYSISSKLKASLSNFKDLWHWTSLP